MNPAPHPATADLRATLLTWGPIVAGLAFMYGPSFVDLFRGIWSTDEQAHGPIVLGVSCWLVWRIGLLRSHSVISKVPGGRRHAPYAPGP